MLFFLRRNSEDKKRGKGGAPLTTLPQWEPGFGFQEGGTGFVVSLSAQMGMIETRLTYGQKSSRGGGGNGNGNGNEKVFCWFR